MSVLSLLLLWACDREPPPATAPDPTPALAPPGPGSGGGGGGGPMGPPPGPMGSGAALQDPSGFPVFHDWPAPPGPPITAMGTWSPPVRLTTAPSGGYRPQIAVSPVGDQLHVVYYDRVDAGDIIRHRRSTDGGANWTAPLRLGEDKERNWGPDLVAQADGSVVVVYDHALPDMRSRGYLTTWDPARDTWSPPEPLTPDDGGEIGSGHVAHDAAGGLAYVFIGKRLGPQNAFQARWRWRVDGVWSEIQAFSDGLQDAWHTNVERRPDGSVLAGYDVGTGGAETTLYLVEGRGGQFGTPENLSASGPRGERPHFAFAADGTDHVTWFHKQQGKPVHIYIRSGGPGRWGTAQEPSRGYGGFHFDPDIAINPQGVLCLVWGWDNGQDAELVYALHRGQGQGWSPPRKIADLNQGKPGLASIDVDSQGRFHVVWNQGVRGSNEVYYAHLDPGAP